VTETDAIFPSSTSISISREHTPRGRYVIFMLVPPNVFLQYIMLSKLFQAAAALRLRKKRLLRQINTDAGEVRKTISGVFIMK
jgi:hypothetical protein